AVVSAWCSPIERCVRGSFTLGATGARSLGRIEEMSLSFWPAVLARESFIRVLRSRSLTTIGASEVESTPAAIPDSIWPRVILFAIAQVASIDVAHAR